MRFTIALATRDLFGVASLYNLIDCEIGQYKMQTADCRLQIGFKMQTWYKMQAAGCRLGLKCRVRPKLSHRLI